MSQYSQTVRDYFYQPRHVGELKNAVVGVAHEKQSATEVRLYLVYAGDVIKDASFKVIGDPIVIATCAYVCEQIIGTTGKVDSKAWMAALEIEPKRQHSVLLVAQALTAALARKSP